jgi:serine/threonine protein kinase/tetratricopeptide (TPR) repeat protein
MNNSLPPTTSALPADVVPAGLTRLGHYELLDCIGRGGMGLVYRARDTRLDRQVAIKCLRTELFEAHYVERFKREALLLAKLNHPNIVQIYDFIEAPDQLALVMELVEGQNLQLHLREHIVPFSQRMRWLTEIAQGLAVAHDAGIIHRDLKAENILINQRKVAKITDLGIAKSQDFNATLTDHIAGSYCSMSPEQAMGEAIDFKSDLFSFGILAYQLLCGAHPFGDTNNKLQLMQRIISHPPTTPSKHNPNLPAEINDLLGQLLSKDPAKRPDNTHWVAAQLETLNHLQPANDFVSDDTQVLIPGGSAANQAHVKSTGIASTARTQDHPTFETRFVAINTAQKKSHWLPIKNYLLENKISVGFGLFSILILAAVVIWQLQPKPPKYVAVIPPTLTAEGMQESQQELVKEAVYDAIQQSIIQLDNYYLIPRNEIEELNSDFTTILRATAADEIITTELKCETEACAITLTRLIPQIENNKNKARIKNTKTIEVLTDNYLTLAETVNSNTNSLYSVGSTNIFTKITPQEYNQILEITRSTRENGATPELLNKIDGLTKNSKSQPFTQSLYKEIAFDLYHETKNTVFLEKFEEVLKNSQKNNKSYFFNLARLEIEKNHHANIDQIVNELKKLNAGAAILNELNGHSMMAQNDYLAAVEFYKKSLNVKKTANTLFNIANAYWYSGNNFLAKKYINESIELAPSLHKALIVQGLIALVTGEIDQAKAAFEKAVTQTPNDITALSNLGLSHLLLKNYKLASTFFETASRNAPNFHTLKLNRADAENLAGNTQNAQKIYREIVNSLQIGNISAENLRSKSQAYAHLGEFNAALANLRQLELSDPQNIETTYVGALVHSLSQNQASALLYTENALNNGLHPIWFSFPWFDNLCKKREFIDAMRKHGDTQRCPHDKN